MTNLKMNCGYCGRKCSLDKDFCIPQDSVYICKSCYDWKQKVDDLEAKLAESEKNYKDARELSVDQFYSLTEMLKYLQKENDQLKQQLAESDKLMQEYLSKCLSLEQQLAEKYEKIATLMEAVDARDKEIDALAIVLNRECDACKPIQTAIAELEKVVEFIKEYPHEPRYWDIASYIDQQIKSLKGEK